MVVAGKDLNLRPSGYEPDELPDFTPPRDKDYNILTNIITVNYSSLMMTIEYFKLYLINMTLVNV